MVPQKEYPERYHKKRIQRRSMKRESGKIPLDMGQDTNAGHSGCGGNSNRSGKGCVGHGKTTLGMVPCKASEVGACKDLEGQIFTISSGNKGKDRDMFRTSVEKMATYIGTKFGNDAAQKWTRQTKLPEPAYLMFVLAKHAERVKATMD